MAVLDVHVVTPDREVWSGEASFVKARSASGDIGVLPGHQPLLSVLRPGEYKVETVDGQVEIGITAGGFLSISPTQDGVTRVDLLAEQVS